MDPLSKFIKFLFLWACNRLEVEVVDILIKYGVNAVWEERMNIIC